MERGPDDTSPRRHHWVNTLVGVLDASFALTVEEQFYATVAVTRLLDTLDIPGRGEPLELPAALAAETSAGVFGAAMAFDRPMVAAAALRPGMVTVDLADWRDALCRMLFRAYPDLRPEERLYAVKAFDEVLVALGLPNRAPVFIPEDVVSAYGEAR